MLVSGQQGPFGKVRQLGHLSTDRLYGHVVKSKGRTEFLAFARYLRCLQPSRGADRDCLTR